MTNKVALITGAAKRVGAGIATLLHSMDYNIVLHYQHSEKDAKQLANRLNTERAGSAKMLQGDLSDLSSLGQLAQNAVEQFGRIDVLVNNASRFFPTPMKKLDEQQWDALFSTNVRAPLFLSHHLHGTLREHHGVIINLVDIYADRPLKNHTVYSMTKAALASMTKSLAVEFAPTIRVNGVAPGAILWLDDEHAPSDSHKNRILAHVPMQKMGSISDLAQAVGYLVQADYVTGQIIAVDGGRTVTSTNVVQEE